MTGADDVLLVGGGILAGVVGTAGGITSLISYPALLAVGLRPFSANVTNSVGLVATWPGSALGSRLELRGRGRWLRRWMLLSMAGGAGGAALLLSTPADTFERIVPFLLVAASVVLVAQPRLTSWRHHHPARSRPGGDRHLVLAAGLLAVSVYDGYFGAGSGVMVLAVLLVGVDQHLPRANALKNMLVGAANVVSAVAFTFLGPVHWSAALPLAVGLLAGSRIGPSVTRRVPAAPLRLLVALTGVGLATWLWCT